jgi:hypothetical protein
VSASIATATGPSEMASFKASALYGFTEHQSAITFLPSVSLYLQF